MNTPSFKPLTIFLFVDSDRSSEYSKKSWTDIVSDIENQADVISETVPGSDHLPSAHGSTPQSENAFKNEDEEHKSAGSEKNATVLSLHE